MRNTFNNAVPGNTRPPELYKIRNFAESAHLSKLLRTDLAELALSGDGAVAVTQARFAL